MDVCSDGHPEVAYEDYTCPICSMVEDHKEEMKDLEIALKIEEEHSSALELEIADLRSLIEEIKPHHPEYFV